MAEPFQRPFPELHPGDSAALLERYRAVERTVPAPERDKEAFRRVFTEYAGQTTPPPTAASASTGPPGPVFSPAEEGIIQSIIEEALASGLHGAIGKARGTHRPEIIDAVHDRLTDEYWEKLVAAKRITT